MTDWVEWFGYQLRASGEGFIWATQQVNPAFYYRLPPDPVGLGMWSSARHVWHVAGYERHLALPSMLQWLGGSIPIATAWPNNDAAWLLDQDRPSNELIGDFQAVRQEQIELLGDLASVDWITPRETIWGEKPLSWVVTKTFQHTWEHGNTLLRMGLWWQDLLDEIAQQGQQSES